MPAKPKNLSPAQQREAVKAAQIQDTLPPKKESEWAPWEKKIERIPGRDISMIISGWLSAIPEINPPGSAPREGIGSIYAVNEVLSQVPKKGDKDVSISGGRSTVLHEAFYLINKAIHVQISCAKSVALGNHTWAVVDAYQASLFALGGIMAFLGLTVEREDNDFVLIDVWGLNANLNSSKSASTSVETYKFIRFKTLDHFHKWAILKRLLRTLKSDSQILVFLLDSIKDVDEKAFAQHRNTVHYQSAGWLANDLLQPDMNGPIKPAKTIQEAFEEIFECSSAGTVYLMCALIELACEFISMLFEKGVLADEESLIERRKDSLKVLTEFDWGNIASTEKA